MIDYGIVKTAAITLLSAVLFSQIKQLNKILQDSKQVKKASVKGIQQLSEIIAKKQNSNLQILKLAPYYFQLKLKKINIHTAQKYKYQPSSNSMAEQVKYELQTRTNFDNQIQVPVKWFAKVQKSRVSKGKDYQQIQGFGKIQGDFFDIKSTYTPIKDMGIWQRFRNWVYKLFYEDSYLIEQSKKNAYFIGPVIGYLNYEIDLMKDVQIIAVCNIKDGKIIPQITATSKSQILNYYKKMINGKYLIIGSLLVGTILIGRWLWSDVKASINSMKVRNNKKNNKYYKMQVPSDDKACIICYNNSRNMIFFDCRHMIMCHDCSEAYESDVCPYCKMEIDDIKPVIGIS